MRNTITKYKDIVTYATRNFVMIRMISKFKNYHKVKDHCHYTGKYRGASKNIWNLRYSTQKEILVVLHNGSAYDFHLIIKELAEQVKREDFISVLIQGRISCKI